jgi:hypothetical protein
LGFAWSDGLVDVDWDWRHLRVLAWLVEARRTLCVGVSRGSGGNLSRVGGDAMMFIAVRPIGEREGEVSK